MGPWENMNQAWVFTFWKDLELRALSREVKAGKGDPVLDGSSPISK